MKKITKIAAAFLVATSIATVFTGCDKNSYKGSPTEFVNSVVLVRFCEGSVFSSADSAVREVYSGEENSVETFLSKVSEGGLTTRTVYLEEVVLESSIKEYMPSYKSINGEYVLINEDGYDNRASEDGGESFEFLERTQRLAESVLKKISSKASVDGDGDGFADLTTFVFDVDVNFAYEDEFGVRQIERGDLLWAKQSEFLTGAAQTSSGENKTFSYPSLGDSLVKKYVFMPLGEIFDGDKIYVATAAHETLHALGAADAYTESGDVEPVGSLDVMGDSPSRRKSVEPVLPLSYVRQKMGFLKEGVDVLPATESGDYVLYPTDEGEGEVKAYKIVLPSFAERGESFYVEYRRSDGDGKPEFDGLIIYRVNEENGYIAPNGKYGKVYYGNLYGEYETYVFRFARETSGGYVERDDVFTNGICYATVSGESGRGVFGCSSGDKNAATYSDGTNSGIIVEFKSKRSDGSVLFSLTIPIEDDKNPAEVDYRDISYDKAGRLILKFYKPFQDGSAYILRTDERLKNPKGYDVASGKYGEPLVVPKAFMRAEIEGEGKFVYVCYGDGGGYTAVETYLLGAVDPTETIKSVLFIGGGVASAIALAALVSAVVIRAKKRKK